MSVIPTTGADDYARTTEWVGQPVYNIVSKALTADDVSGFLDVSNWEAIQIRSPQLSSPPGWVFTFDWFNDSAGTTSLGQRIYRSGQGHPIGDSSLNQGPFLRITTHATSYAGSPAYSLLVVPRNGREASSRNVQDGRLLHSSAVVGAGGVVTFGTLRIATGQAMWHARSTVATNWAAVLQTLDEAGTVENIAEFGVQAGQKGLSQLVLLPALEIQVVMANADAAPQTLDTALILSM